MANPNRNAAFEDLSNVEFETSEDVEVIDSFGNMNLKEELTRGIFSYGKLWIVVEKWVINLKVFKVSRNRQPFSKEQSNP